MHEARVFAIASWVLLPTVMFGGYSLLSLLRRKVLTAEQIDLFRAGHAHAGVLLVMSLIYDSYVASAALPSPLKLAACAAVVAGILLQSGGFFWRAFVDKGGGGTAGHRMTVTGALLLGAAILVLVLGLFRA